MLFHKVENKLVLVGKHKLLDLCGFIGLSGVSVFCAGIDGRGRSRGTAHIAVLLSWHLCSFLKSVTWTQSTALLMWCYPQLSSHIHSRELDEDGVAWINTGVEKGELA